MKRIRKLGILLGVLLIACVAAFAALRYEEHQEKIKNSEETILEIPEDTVTELSWKIKDGDEFSLRKEGDTWIYEADETFPVDAEKVSSMLSMFEDFGVSFVIEDVEDYSQYGLDNPVCTIDLDTSEQSYEITLGDYSKMDSERYVSIGDGNVYLVQNDPYDTFNCELKSLIAQDKVPAFDQISSVEIAGEDTWSFAYSKENDVTYSEDDIYFAEKDGEGSLPLDTSKVNSYFSSLHSADLTDYVTYNADTEDLSQYGLDQPELTLTVNYTSENEDGEDEDGTFVIYISRDPADQDKELSDDEDEDSEDEITAYARVGESNLIYQLSESDYKALIACTYDDLRHKELCWADFEDITKMEFTLDGETYTITADGKKKDLSYTYEDTEIEIADVQNAYGNLKASSFTTEEPSGEEEISMTFYIDNENQPEVTIQLYRYDGSDCLAVVDGNSTALIKRTNAVDMMEAVRSIVLN